MIYDNCKYNYLFYLSSVFWKEIDEEETRKKKKTKRKEEENKNCGEEKKMIQIENSVNVRFGKIIVSNSSDNEQYTIGTTERDKPTKDGRETKPPLIRNKTPSNLRRR